MLDLPSTHLSSTPPIGETSKLIATLPPHVDGRHLKAVRQAANMTQDQFASLIGVTSMWLLQFERGDMPLSKCRMRTQELVACAMIKLKIRLTEDGWEVIPDDGGGG